MILSHRAESTTLTRFQSYSSIIYVLLKVQLPPNFKTCIIREYISRVPFIPFIFFSPLVLITTQSPKALNRKICLEWSRRGLRNCECFRQTNRVESLNCNRQSLEKKRGLRGSLVVSDILLPMSIMNSNPVLHIGPKVSKATG